MLLATLALTPFLLQDPSPPPRVPAAVATPDPVDREGFPYDRYTTTDALGRRVTFYLSKAPAGGGALPLVLAVQGSGSQSLFLEVDTPQGKRIASGGPEAALLRCARDRVRVLAVEKPGVTFLVQPARPGSAEEGSETFRKEHTLERWIEALHASVEAAASLPGVAAGRVLALGHSEGGQVVCHLAGRSRRVTHVASFAGGGPTQLYDLLTLAREGRLGVPGATPEARVAWLTSAWNEVLAAPDAHDRDFLGHPHRRWTSFLRKSALAALLTSEARVFLAQGSADSAVAASATDMLHAELLARGRAVVYERLADADHGLCTPKDHERRGWLATHEKAVAWFLGAPGEGRADAAASRPGR